MDPELSIKRRRLPHWQLQGSIYFLTFRLLYGELSMAERLLVLQHIHAGHGQFYELFAAVVMPDHGHLLLKPLPAYDLTQIMKGVKGVSARLVNKSRGRRGSLWQDESFDRIVRDAAEFEEKLVYIINNPAKRELVADPWDYPALLVVVTDG